MRPLPRCSRTWPVRCSFTLLASWSTLLCAVCRDYDRLKSDLHEAFDTLVAPPDIFARALDLQCESLLLRLVERRQPAGVADVEIRPARLEDADSFRKNCKTRTSTEQVRAQLEWTTRERSPHHLEHFVAVENDEVVGTVMLWPKGGHAVENDDGAYTLCRGCNGAGLDIARLDDWVVTGPRHGTGIGARVAWQ